MTETENLTVPERPTNPDADAGTTPPTEVATSPEPDAGMAAAPVANEPEPAAMAPAEAAVEDAAPATESAEADDAVEASAEPIAEPAAEGDAAQTAVEAEAKTEVSGESRPAEAASEEASPVEAAPESAEPKAAVAAGDDAKGEAKKGKKGKPRRKRRPTPRMREEFVAPTPEELAAISSETVRAAIENSTPVGGKVIGWNQGGFHVVVDGITSFCPKSSMELGAPPHEPAQYLDQEYLFRVLRVEDKGHRLVLSRAAVLREERKHKAEERRKEIEVGAVLKGKVVAVLDFGAFVDLDGVEGLLHVSEIKHDRVEKASDELSVGQELEVKVVALPKKKSDRFSLSLRAMQPNPWDDVEARWPRGGPFTGKILRKTEFGWFVELADGVEGLLHPSQLAPGMKEDDPKLAIGAEIEGWVREVDGRRRRVSLALREVPTSDPWKEAGKKYLEGEVVTGTVERIERFGAFIELEPGVTGLLPASEMGLPRGASIGRSYQPGREVKLKISEVDPRRRRISLTREDKALEGSRSDYRNYLKKAQGGSGLGQLAAALERILD